MSTAQSSTYVPAGAAAGRRPPRNLLLGMMVAVFFSGGVIGSGSTLMLINRRIEDNARHYDPIKSAEKVTSELEVKLSLDSGQAAQVEQIMKDHLAALDRLRREVFFKKIREQFKQMEDQVNAVLDDEQRTQWHAWLAERQQRVCPSVSRRTRTANGGAVDRPGRVKNGTMKPAADSHTSTGGDSVQSESLDREAGPKSEATTSDSHPQAE
ncbi:MAG TPA: hypothetical protein VHC22_09705 [Pirellulales bacterium]|nr:hypothetical protein [Pirellulales bacterium]